MIASVIIGVAVAIWIMRAESQRHSVDAVLQLHGRVVYTETALPIPSSLVRLLEYGQGKTPILYCRPLPYELEFRRDGEVGTTVYIR